MIDPFNKLVMDWEDCLAQKQAEIERLTKERDEARAMLVQTQLELLALKGECEKDHRSFNEAAKFSTECIASLTKRVEELEKERDETTENLRLARQLHAADKRRLDWLETDKRFRITRADIDKTMERE